MPNIYGLFGPRFPGVIMYVGKGFEKRAQYHWRFYLRKGAAVNSLLRAWFDRLKSVNIKPSYRFLEENVEN
jgi:hypothetical protein